MKKILLALVILSMFAVDAFAFGSLTTVTIVKRENWGASRVVYGYLTYAAEPYVALGMELTARDLGISNINEIVVSGMSSSTIGWNYDYTNEKIRLYYAENSNSEPTTTPTTADYFHVVNTSTADSTTTSGGMVWISTNSSALAYLGTMAAKISTSSATKNSCITMAADSVSTLIVAHDTVTAIHVTEVESLAGADTVYFDANATNSYDRLMYSGSGLGNMGDLYIPYDNGNYIKVAKKTSLEIYTAAARPLYFDADGTALDMKFVSNCSPNANSTFSVDQAYTSLVNYNPYGTEEVADGTTVTAVVRFIAIGN
jgi:hypothetical protein